MLWLKVVGGSRIVNISDCIKLICVEKDFAVWRIKICDYNSFIKIGRYENKEDADAELDKIRRALKNGSYYCEINQGLPPLEYGEIL